MYSHYPKGQAPPCYDIRSAREMASTASMATVCIQCQFRLQLHVRRIFLNGMRHDRNFHSTGIRHQNTPQFASRGLGDFYNDLLQAPLPKVAKAKIESDLPEWVAAGGRKDIEERARKLFGNIEGSGYQRSTSDTPDATWRTINGVPVPPRPAEPDNCCMSGCVQ